jgi:hypothetical protein
MPDPSKYTAGLVGQKVNRAAAALPQTAQTDYFTISGGKVMVLGILGEVTTVMGATASNLKVVHNPTAAGVADTDLCAVAATANDPVGTQYGITGIPSDALQKGGFVPLPQRPLILQPGTIALNASGSNTGQTKWTVFYLPLDTGAKIAAA